MFEDGQLLATSAYLGYLLLYLHTYWKNRLETGNLLCKQSTTISGIPLPVKGKGDVAQPGKLGMPDAISKSDAVNIRGIDVQHPVITHHA